MNDAVRSEELGLGGGRVVLVGGGIAGAAAALAAAGAGARVTLVEGGVGATTLWTGGIDGVPAREEAVAIASQLGAMLGTCTLVTNVGLRRSAQGREAALLDASAACVGVVQCDRTGWDAEIVARAAGEGFVLVPCTVLRHSDERVLPDADFASRHDDDARLGWLAERLREALVMTGARVQALLLPPSLGIERSRAAALSERVGVPCGEATAMPGGPAGLRFERTRDRALSAAGVTVVTARATSIERASSRWRIHLHGDRVLDADSVVVATGGLVGGGIEYQPSEAMLAAVLPPSARPAFRCTLGGPLPLGSHGRPIDLPGSLFGVAPESIAWPLSHDRTMDRVGVLAKEEGRVAPGLYVAGELLADAARTWLCALDSGVAAGLSAARDAIRALPARPASRGEAPASRP